MSEVSKFIPMDDNGGIGENAGTGVNGGVKTENSAFKVCANNSNLPVKPSIWTRLKSVLTYEIKVELTPYQQKIEDEINEFLHQEVTWQSFKNFLFQDVVITTGKNRT